MKVRVIEYTLELDGQPQTYRLISSLMDTVLFPALSLATEYHQRWEVENTIDELKIHLLGRKTHVRSQKPREVVQEVYGWLLGHWAVRVLMFQAASSALRSSITSIVLQEHYESSAVLFLNFNVYRKKSFPFFQLVDCRDSRYIVTRTGSSV